jgi:hypothetical protein
MVWTKDKLAQLPEPYRDFLRILKPVIDSRKPETILRITGIPFGMLYGRLADKYDYSPQQVRELADNLLRAGYVQEDKLGFFTPTVEGEQLVLALVGAGDLGNGGVPPLPIFTESGR